jgi:cytoskeletal protein CcmA (bactofilin family)
MDTAAHIGPSIQIRGEVTACEPLTVAGRVDGSIVVDGHVLTIAASGQVSATLSADTVDVGGTVAGAVSAGARIIVRETARIEGDLTAPAVSLAAGAQVQGRVRTAERSHTFALA